MGLIEVRKLIRPREAVPESRGRIFVHFEETRRVVQCDEVARSLPVVTYYMSHTIVADSGPLITMMH